MDAAEDHPDEARTWGYPNGVGTTDCPYGDGIQDCPERVRTRDNLVRSEIQDRRPGPGLEAP